MTVLRMVVESLGLLLVALLVLSVIGFGVVELAVPELRGLEWLLSPVVGLAVLYLACQWLSPWLASSVIVVAVVVAGAVLSAGVVWRRYGAARRDLVLRPFDLVATGLTGTAAYLALLAHQFKLGFFTLAGTGLDALFIYAPVGEFMRVHAYAAGDTPPVKTPAISTLEADFYPGSLGTVEGGLSALVDRPVYQIIEPLNAVCMVLAILGVYVLVVGVLRMSRLTGVVAMLVMATNQFLFWAAGFDFVQQIRASAILPGALALALWALERGRVGAAIVAGAMAAAMVAVYMPVLLILVVATAGGLLVAAAVGIVRKRWTVSPAALGALVGSGVLFGLTHVHWLLFDGGLDAWNLVSQDKFGPYAAGGMLATHYSPAELLGTVSLADVYRLQPLLFWGSAWSALGTIVALVAVALGLFGMVRLVRTGRWLWVGMVGGVLAYLVYVRFGPTNLYGFVKTVSYVVPVTSVIVAVGAASLAGLRLGGRARGGVGRPLPALAAAGAVTAILGMQVAAAVETEHLFLQLPPTISEDQDTLRQLDELVPERASVLIQDPGPLVPGTPLTPNAALNHIAAYFLSGRDVTLAGPLDPNPPGRYDYVLAPSGQPPGPGDRPVWTGPAVNLTLYQRPA